MEADYLTVTKHGKHQGQGHSEEIVWRRLHWGSHAWITFWILSKNSSDQQWANWWKDSETLFSSREYKGKSTAHWRSSTRSDLKYSGIRFLPSILKSLTSFCSAGEPLTIFSWEMTGPDVHFRKITFAICLKDEIWAEKTEDRERIWEIQVLVVAKPD